LYVLLGQFCTILYRMDQNGLVNSFQMAKIVLFYNMASIIQQDSYWYLDGENEEAVMNALCSICAKKQKKGWRWEGRLGYGDYDLFCESCGNAIHLRGENEVEAEAGNKSK
jgi:hypothetical protein